jgi:pimeloyl-ACP methyl ester carboxylesterase
VEVHGAPTDRVPLLLTHGFGSSGAMWQSNLDALSSDRQVITWDVRGHGSTVTPPIASYFTHDASVADMVAVLDACGVEAAAVGGLSLGGYLSLAFYAAAPTRVSALLLFDTGPGFKQDEGRARWNAFAQSRADAFEREGLTALADSAEVRLAKHDPVGLAHAARGILTQSDDQIINSLPRIDVPTLILVGAADQPFLAAADYMAAKIPGSVRVVLADAGHASNVDQPEAFSSAVASFLRGIDSP